MRIVGLTKPPAASGQTKPAEHICEHCGKEFGSKAALTKHINKEHTEK